MCAAKLRQPFDSDKAAELFKALGDPTRLSLLYLVAETDEVRCIDLTRALGISAPTVTHHMKRLAAASLVSRTKKGKWAFYSVNRPEFDRVNELIEAL